MQDSAPAGHVFTTLGWIPSVDVELRESVTEDDDTKVVRTDKYVSGQWVGNDLHVIVKRPVPLSAESGTF